MAISYVGGQVGNRAGATSAISITYALTGGSNSVPQAGDCVIITAVAATQAATPAQAITVPATWTALGQLNVTAQTYDTSLNVSYKFMGSTPDTTFTLPSSGSNQNGQAYLIQVFRGVDPNNPMDVVPVSASATGTTRANPGPITPAAAGAWILVCAGGAAAAASVYTFSALSNVLSSVGVDTNDAVVGGGYYSAWTSGAYDPAVSSTGDATATSSWASYTLALRPLVGTRLYLHFDSPSEAHVPWILQTFHPSLPSAKNYNGTDTQYPRGLRLTSGTPTYIMGSPMAGDTTDTTQPMSFYFGKCCSHQLAAQTIPVQRWELASYAGQTSSIGETYWRPCIYIWRPSTQSVVGFIANGGNDLGYDPTYWAEWSDAITPNSTNAWVLPPSGAPGGYVPQEITTQNGDMLIIEMWAWVRAGQSATGDATRTVYFNAPETWLECDTTVLLWKTPDPISSLQEDFNAPRNPAKWTTDLNNGSVTFENGTGDFVYTSTVNTTHASMISVDSFIFKDSSAYYKVEQPPNWAGNPAGGEFSFTIESPGNNRIDWTIYSTNSIELIKFTNNTWGSIKLISSAYQANKDTYRWLRFREAAGTTYFESAPSTASNPPIAGDWVVQHSALTSSFPIDPLSAKVVWRLWISNPVAGIASPMPKVDGLNTASGAPAGETILVPRLAETQTLQLPVIIAHETIAIPKLTETQTFRDVTIISLVSDIVLVPKLTETQTFRDVTIIFPEIVTIPLLTETQTLLLPAINALGVGTNLIFISDTANIAPTAGDNATSLPILNHNTNASNSGTDGVLSAFWGGPSQQASRVANAENNIVDYQSYYFGRFSTRPLAAQTIPAQNWSYQASVGETSVNSNTFFWPVMYIWRPGTGVIKYIFDASADTGAEWPQATSIVAQSFVGAQVTTQEGDILVVEAWGAGKQTTGGTYAQTWVVNLPTSKIVSPYTLQYSFNSVLWFTSNIASVAPTAGKKASNLPLATNTNSLTIANEYLWSEIAPNDTNQINRSANQQSALGTQQSVYIARFSTLPLAAQTIPAQVWSYEVSTSETSDNANTFFWPVMYVWRPSPGQTVSPYIFDASGPQGLEWRVADDPRLDQYFTGASVTTQEGDILVVEIWGVGTQSTAAGTYTQRMWTNSFNSRIVSPYKLIYSGAAPGPRHRIVLIT